MDFDELLITTGVDALIKLVKEKKQIELVEAASILKIPLSTVRGWAQILEEENLILIQYKFAKSYLIWRQPTEEEVKKEEQTFSEDKSKISKQINRLNEEVYSEKQSIEQLRSAFKKLYDSLYPKLSELEKQTHKLSQAEDQSKIIAPKVDPKLKEVETKIDDLESMLVFTQSQLNKTKKDILEKGINPDEITGLKSVKEDINNINEKLSALEDKAYKTLKLLPEDTVKYADFPKELEKIKKEFESIASEGEKLRTFFLENEENLKTFKKMEKQMNEKSSGLSELKSEIGALSKDMGSIEKRFSELSVKLKDYEKIANSFSSSDEISKILTNSQEFSKVIEGIETKERAIASKISELEKSGQKLEGVGELVRDFEKIRSEIDQKRDALSQTASDVFHRLDEEDETYKVFQTIKEKAVASIEEYNSQLSSIKKQLESVSSEVNNIEQTLKTGIKNAVETTNEPQVNNLLQKLSEVKEKKKLFDNISSSMTELEDRLDNLSKKVLLLSKQSELIELKSRKAKQVSGIVPPEVRKEIQAEESEIENEVELTKSEQIEFKKKRTELMSMIKKLWDEE